MLPLRDNKQFDTLYIAYYLLYYKYYYKGSCNCPGRDIRQIDPFSLILDTIIIQFSSNLTFS